MDEFLWMRLLGGAFGSAMEWVGIITFLAVGIVYLVAPALGYRPERRRALAAALYLLLAHESIGLVELLVQYGETVDTVKSMVPQSGRESMLTLFFGFRVVKMILLLAGMLAFVFGLQGLRLKTGGMPARPAPSRREEPADEPEENAEESAGRDLARAQQLITQDRGDEAVDVLEQLLRAYPSSRAAITARVTLRRLRSSE